MDFISGWVDKLATNVSFDRKYVMGVVGGRGVIPKSKKIIGYFINL